MKRSMRGGSLALALLWSGCVPGRGGDGESYRVGGDPWAPRAPSAETGRASSANDAAGAEGAARPMAAKGDGGETAHDDAPADKGAERATPPAPATSSDLAAGNGTVLEQLDTARRRVAELDGENRRLTGEVAALTAVVDQLKRDNQNLAQLAQASQESRSVVDGELDSLQAKIKDLELRSRQLADDLLAERIKRVRVERQLILAKVTEAESQGDGP